MRFDSRTNYERAQAEENLFLSSIAEDNPRYLEWLTKVNNAVVANTGVDLRFVPETDLLIWFSDGLSVPEAAIEAIDSINES